VKFITLCVYIQPPSPLYVVVITRISLDKSDTVFVPDLKVTSVFTHNTGINWSEWRNWTAIRICRSHSANHVLRKLYTC